jgi:hypothetical protein
MTTTTATPSSYRPTRPAELLRLALRLDAGVTGLNGAGYLAGASLLDGVLGLDATLLRWVGAFLLAYAAVVWVVGNRPAISVAAAGAVVAANLVWAVDSIALAALDWGSPSTLGTVWVLLQAGVVGGFAALQWVALRRSTRT